MKKENQNVDEYLEKCKKELPEHILKFIEECKNKEHPDSHLISILHKVQDEYGYLAKEKMEAVAQLMQIPAARVSGVATFYHYFRINPVGKLVISVCLGTACHVKGADLVAKKLEDELGIAFGETTTDGLFTLEPARCLGMCAMAPIIKIGDDIHSHVTPDQIPAILESYFEKYNHHEKKK